MDLNHIELPSSLVAELYHSVLIESDRTSVSTNKIKEKPVVIRSEAPEIKFLGENKKQILVVANYTDAVHLTDEDLSLLIAMLTACKLTLADVAIVNLNNITGKDGKELVKQFTSRVVFLFGVDPVSFGLPMSFPEFQLQAFSGATYLFAPPLNEYNDNPALKRKLWESLKRLFVI